MPAPWRRPAVLLWIYLLPQLILLALNLRSYHLVAGEMSPEQRGHAFTLAAYAVALLIGVGGVWLATRVRGCALRWTLAVPLLLAHVGYLWMTLAWLDHLIPSTVAFWMLPPERVLYHQFALMMPAVFHSALILACFPTRVGAGRDMARTALLLVAVPAVWYVVIHVAFRIHRMSIDLPDVVVFLLLTISTLLLTGALLRMLAALWMSIRRAGGHGRLLLLALIGVAGPLGGLWLNAYLPFPVDFQSVAVYVLAALNGLVLLLPGTGVQGWSRWIWLAQCVAFPFTLYFFLVFLPFLPLALLAVVAMGAGFLMLVPTALCLVHLSVLREGWQAARPSRGWRVAGLLALLVLPGLFATRAALDRIALRQALDYLYEPQVGQHTFPGHVAAVGRSLRNLRDFKAGLQLPFLTEFYSQVVFGGLVLPEARMQDMHRAFFGRDLDAPAESRLTNPLLGRGRNRMWRGRLRAPVEWPHEVEISELRSEAVQEAGVERVTVTLKLANRGLANSEFVAPIVLPAGTWVSGFWLDVAGELVPGRLFEKKTALWVYEMIRDQTRRDPGLLVYRDPKTVELRVFPFAAGEVRTVQMEFLQPSGCSAPLTIGNRTVVPILSSYAAEVVRVQAGERGLYVLQPRAWRDVKPVRRPEYLHVVLDHSVESEAPENLWPRVEAAARQLGVDRCMVSLVNYEVESVTQEPMSLAEAQTLLLSTRLPARGGFCRDRAVKGALQDWQDHRADTVPLILVVTARTNGVASDADLAWYASAWPGMNGYYVTGSSGDVQAVDWAGHPTATEPVRSWVHLELDGLSPWIPADATAPVLLVGPAAKEQVAEIQHPRYRLGAQAWLAAHARWQSPGAVTSDLEAVVEASRSAGVLVPATSYIVVENSAQWRFLEQSEQQKLGQNSALEFRDSPEPSVWLLGAGFAAWLLWRKRCRSRSGYYTGETEAHY
jgi:hypothetical protein